MNVRAAPEARMLMPHSRVRIVDPGLLHVVFDQPLESDDEDAGAGTEQPDDVSEEEGDMARRIDMAEDENENEDEGEDATISGTTRIDGLSPVALVELILSDGG